MTEELQIKITAELSKFKSEVNNAKGVIQKFVKEGTKDFGALNDEVQKVGDIAKKRINNCNWSNCCWDNCTLST